MQTLVLAQLPSSGPPPAPLPGGGIGVYLFENPWPLVVVLVVGAAVAFWYLNKSGKGPMAVRVAVTAVLAAAAVYLTATLVTTDRERIRAETARLVDLAAKTDRGGVEAMLTPDATFQGAGGPVQDRDELLALIDKARAVKLDSYRITSSHSVIDGKGLGRTQVRVTVRSKDTTFYDAPIGSWWRLHWRRDDAAGTWRVFAIECLQIDGGNPAEVAR